VTGHELRKTWDGSLVAGNKVPVAGNLSLVTGFWVPVDEQRAASYRLQVAGDGSPVIFNGRRADGGPSQPKRNLSAEGCR
jgi:hypothetical protein